MSETLPKKSKKKRKAKKVEGVKRDLLVVSDSCKNCGTSLQLDQQFCSNCGSKRILNRLNARNLLEDFTERFLNIENVFLKTFLALWTRPDDVINGYINGLRKKYMSAFSYFAVALTLGSIYIFVFRNWYMDDIGSISELFKEGYEAGAKGVKPNAQVTDTFTAGAVDIMNKILDYNSFFSFVYVPFYAMISKIVFWNYKQVNFIEHLVIYLYSYSQTSIVTSVLMILFGWSAIGQIAVSSVVSTLPFFYTAYVLYKVFDLDINRLILKTLLFLTILFPLGLIFFAILGGGLYATGMFDPFIEGIMQQVESQKAAKAIKDSIPADSIKTSVEIAKDSIFSSPIVRDTISK